MSFFSEFKEKKSEYEDGYIYKDLDKLKDRIKCSACDAPISWKKLTNTFNYLRTKDPKWNHVDIWKWIAINIKCESCYDRSNQATIKKARKEKMKNRRVKCRHCGKTFRL